MSTTTIPPLVALRYEVEVLAGGRVELQVPFTVGERVMVIVVPESSESFNDLTAASQGRLDFRDHPFDDEDWNNAYTG